MPRKLTNKQIADTISRVAETYFRAANVPGMDETTQQYITTRWAIVREFAILLTQKNPQTLESIVGDADNWLRTARAVADEMQGKSHPMGQSG